MAVTQATSRLEVLQARFQQKQMQEKEQKLLQLYNQQQQRAYHVVKRSSAGSTGSVSQQHSVTRTTTTTHTSNTPQGGKVRQMFDERRQTTVKGIDRSYPLEPLDNKSKRQTAIASNGHLPSKADKNSTVMRQTVTVKRTAKADINSNINGGKPIVSYQEEVSHQFFGNENHKGEFHNGEDSLTNQTGDNIEKILNDDTIEKNRMLAKIHLMEYDDNLRLRVNNDLNNEQFPEDLLVDVPDKLPRQPIARKLSPAEARLERFKNSNARKSKATVTTTVNHSELRKRSEPRSQSAKSISRVQTSPSPEPAGKKSTTSTTKTLIRRSIPSSPTRNTDIITTRGSASSKRPEPKPVRKSLQGVPKHHAAVDTTDTISALEESSGMNATDTLDLENRSEFQSPADGKKSLTHSSTTSQKSMKVIDIDGNSSAKEPTAITKQTSKKISTELTSTTQNQRRSSPNTSPSPRPSSARSTASSTTSTARGTSSAERESRPMATKTKNPTRSPGTTSTISTRGLPTVRNDSTALSSDALVACKACGRRFAQDRVSLHEKICAKTGQKKRKQFNAALHRVQGTELETFAKKSTPTGRQAEHRPKAKKPEPNTKSNWRRKHEDFINAIRSAKQVQAHLAAGGKLSDLPPPPASDTSDYIQCPHCSRKFNQSAAERHIPKCATMMHNKPNSRSLPKPKR